MWRTFEVSQTLKALAVVFTFLTAWEPSNELLVTASRKSVPMENLGVAAHPKRIAVKSVVVLQPGADGAMTSTVILEEKRRRRVSKRWRPLEKALRRVSLAQSVAADDYLRRHKRSSEKKKNGVLRDLGKNMWRAQRKGRKKLKIRFL